MPYSKINDIIKEEWEIIRLQGGFANRKGGKDMNDLYFFILTAINLFVLVFMCVLVHMNDTLNPKQANRFLFTFILIGAISFLEMLTVLVDGAPVWLVLRIF